MGDYKRSTREMELQQIPVSALQAIENHIEIHGLGDVLRDVLICIEARSEKIKKGLFSTLGLKNSVAYVVVTKNWLFESVSADGLPFFAHSAHLANVTVTDYKRSAFYSKIPDNGVEVSGSFTDAAEGGSKFIGVGDDEMGERFKALLIETVQTKKR